MKKRNKFLSLVISLSMLAITISTALICMPVKLISAEETASISMSNTTLNQGDSIAFSCTNTAAKDWICIYPKGFSDKYKYYDYLYANVAEVTFPSGATSRYLYGESSWPLAAGEYVAVLYANDTYTEIITLEFKVVNNQKTAVMDKLNYIIGETITVTTTNWITEDHDFIRIYTNPVGNYNSGYVAQTYNNWGKTTYTFDTSSWAAGTYRMIAFDKGNFNNHINSVIFTVSEPSAGKTAVMDKASYVIGETITVTTTNWITEDHDFIRIYQTPVGNYNDFKVQTYNNWGKSSYTFNTTGWEAGEYRMIAFDKGSFTTPFIADVTFQVTEPAVVKKATMNKTAYEIGDIITVTTENWVAADQDFMRIYTHPVTNYTSGFVANTYGNWGLSEYTFNTSGWAAGTYRLLAFDKGNWNAHIADITFTLTEPDAPPIVKSATMTKTTFTQDEQIVVTTENWIAADRDFIRIYTLPVTNYNAGFIAQTYGTWAKSTYTFFPSAWEPGTYRLIAFDKGSFSAAFIADITFTVTAVPGPEPNENYITDGETITFLKDYELDLSEVPADEIEGKLFIGWVDSEGDPVDGIDTFEKDTVLSAKYINYSSETEGDFAIRETELRTKGTRGFRFIVEKSKALTEALPGISEYGTIVLPSDILNENSWADLYMGEEYTYKNESYTPAIIKGEKTYKTFEDRIYYTLCLTGISSAKYTRQYTVRGYIKYTDLNGFEQILYTNYVSSNPYAVAVNSLEGGELTVSAQSLLEEIIADVKSVHKTKYEDKTKINVVGTNADPRKWIYSLGENGIFVREAKFDSGKGGDPVEIVHLTDFHYNYLNARDYKEKNPTLLSTALERTFGANASFALAVRNSLEYARTADQIVITGDVLDYLSWGNIELTYKEIWDKHPSAIITMGNHEYLQKMQGLMNETLTLEKRWQWVQNSWKHDIYYSSKVVKDKVMVIQLNNGEGVFYDSQIEPLQRDIAIAKEEGYVVLLFMHETLYTNNPAETSVNALRVNDSDGASNQDFYQNSQGNNVGSPTATGATKTVYEIITNNADVIKGIFNGHRHSDFYTELIAKTSSGTNTVIPQYTLTGALYDNGRGHAIKITVD